VNEAGGWVGGKKGGGARTEEFSGLDDSRDERIGDWDDSMDVEVKALICPYIRNISSHLLSLEAEKSGGFWWGLTCACIVGSQVEEPTSLSEFEGYTH